MDLKNLLILFVASSSLALLTIRSGGIVIKPLRNSTAVSAIEPLTFNILFMRRVLISWGF